MSFEEQLNNIIEHVELIKTDNEEHKLAAIDLLCDLKADLADMQKSLINLLVWGKENV